MQSGEFGGEELKQGAAEAPKEKRLVFAGEFVFPNPKDGPSGFAQGANHKEIAFFVGGKFAPPEGAIVHGQIGMFGAGVPETAVHEKREPHATENEIRFAEHGLIAPPAGDAVASHQFGQREFGLFIAAPANPRHDFGTFLFGEDVRHGLTADNCYKSAISDGFRATQR